jgi:diguanylate cyclase (GGDEF)-like protein
MHALRRFNLQPDQRVHMRLIVAATIIFEVLLTYTWHSMRGRIVLVSLAIAAIASFGIDAIYRRRSVTRAEHMVGVLLFGGIVVMLLRAMIVPATSMLDVTMSSPMQGVVFTYAASMPVISTVAFVLMCGERINASQSQQAMIDPLTGVYNRQAMAELANKAIALARLDGRPLALLSVDIDHFGRFNEDFGYDVGDQALCHVVDILRDTARPDDVMARVTGERFMLMLPDTDADTAFALACEMRMQVDQSGFASGGWPAPLQVSIGVAVLDEEKADFDQLLRRADQALNVAKRAGRNRVALGDRIEVLPVPVESGAVNA